MRIILLKDIPKVGRKFEVKEVSDGYANNLLFPRGLAEMATPQALVKLHKEIEASVESKKIELDLLHKNFNTLKNTEVKLIRPANEEGHLFAGVKETEIKNAIETQLGITLPKDFIDLEHPLKTVGEHSVNIKSGNIKGTIKIIIETE